MHCWSKTIFEPITVLLQCLWTVLTSCSTKTKRKNLLAEQNPFHLRALNRLKSSLHSSRSVHNTDYKRILFSFTFTYDRNSLLSCVGNLISIEDKETFVRSKQSKMTLMSVICVRSTLSPPPFRFVQKDFLFVADSRRGVTEKWITVFLDFIHKRLDHSRKYFLFSVC